jgi:CheY-like chemotaxis protein
MAIVLIVDDDPKLLTMLRRTLAYEGFHVLSATNGTEALGEVQAHRPDVVVLDWLMPGLDGIGVLEHLRTAGDKTLALTLTHTTLDAIPLGLTTLEKALASGDIQIAGDGKKFAELLSLLDTCQADFSIVTP